MSNEEECQRLVERFFSLWQQESLTKLHQPEVASGALSLMEAIFDQAEAYSAAQPPQTEGNQRDLSDDAIASLFRYLVEQLPERGNSAGEDTERGTGVEPSS